MGMLLRVTGNPKDVPGWAGLAAGIFVAYQMRPAYLFLIALVPLLGIALRYLSAIRFGQSARLTQMTMGLVASSVLPFLAFCSLRWVLVGHWGLVSFGGTSLLGISGQFLTESMVSSLPEHLQPLATAAIRRRTLDPEWQTMHVEDGRLHFGLAENLYDPTIYRHFGPAVKDVWPQGDYSSANVKMGEMAKCLICARPELYACWIGDAFWAAVQRIPQLPRVKYSIVLGLIALLGWVSITWKLPIQETEKQTDVQYALQIMGLLALMFTLAKVLQVVVVEMPLSRYLEAAAVFIPPFAAVILFGFLDRVRKVRKPSCAMALREWSRMKSISSRSTCSRRDRQQGPVFRPRIGPANVPYCE